MVTPSTFRPTVAVCAGPAPDFDLEAKPDSLTLSQGSSNTATIVLASLNGFKGTVTLKAASDLTVSLSRGTVDLTRFKIGTSTLTVSANPTATLGGYWVRLEAVTSTTLHEVSVPVEVLGPDFSVEAEPTMLTMAANESKTSTIIVTSENGFEGTVSLSADSSRPSDLTVSLNLDSVDLTPEQSKAVELTVTSTGSTPSGNYEVAVQGRSPSKVHDRIVFVTVTGPDFVMTPDPRSLTIGPNSRGTATIMVKSLYGFEGPVNLAVVPPLPPLSASLDRLSVILEPGGSATATLTVTVQTATAPFTIIEVRGTGAEKAHTTSVAVNVPGPGIDLSTSPRSLSVDPGSSGGATVTVKSLFDFEGTAEITTTTTDTCLDVTPSTWSVTLQAGGSEASILSITVDAITPPGTYYAEISGQAGGGTVFDYARVIVTVAGDTTQPIWPTGNTLTYSEVAHTSVSLSWMAAADDVAIESYLILQDGIPAATVSGAMTSLAVLDLSPNTTYKFQTVAYDSAGNFALGPSVNVTTASEPQQSPPAPQPFWVEYWFVIAILVMFLVGIPVASKMRGSPKARD